MKIILYTPSIHTGGGTERVLVNLSNELTERGYSIKILAQNIGENYIYDLNNSVKIDQIWYDRISLKHRKNGLFKIISKLFGGFLLQLALKKHVTDDIKAIISFSNSISIGCFKTKYKDKLIAFEHWPYWTVEQNPKLQAKINCIYPQLSRLIVLTEHDKHVYENLGCKVSLIQNSYTYYPHETSTLTHKNVLSIGHFNNQKRRDLLIKSWKFINKEFPDWSLTIVGDGPSKEDTIKLINGLNLQNSIKIVPPTKDIYDYYLESSVFIMSSEYEALPMVLIEAKTFGLPCISFDIKTGPNEIIRNNIDGFLVKFSDCEVLAKKACVLLEDIALRKKFGDAARKDALLRFDSNVIYNKWEDLLKGI